jgi:hypothetical protein
MSEFAGEVKKARSTGRLTRVMHILIDMKMIQISLKSREIHE